MVNETVENFLELSEPDLRSRMDALRSTLPTIPGNEYLKARLKQYEVEPWPFLKYLEHNYPSLLRQALGHYTDYSGAAQYQTVMEQLREQYVMVKLLIELENEKKTIDVTPLLSQ